MKRIFLSLVYCTVLACGSTADVRQVDAGAAAEASEGYTVSNEPAETIKSTVAPDPASVAFQKLV